MTVPLNTLDLGNKFYVNELLKFCGTTTDNDYYSSMNIDQYGKLKTESKSARASTPSEGCSHAFDYQNRSGAMNAYMTYTMTCDGWPIYKSVLSSERLSDSGVMECSPGPNGYRFEIAVTMRVR
ncbi:hypothetical protein V3C99_017862 [Haemonchus contortus]|uniref:Fibrinogen C-terminal domain-containing protein n=1 Tax=Haemonchus contortus TaxID=6289 RepID=A0A7I5EE72_HAECO